MTSKIEAKKTLFGELMYVRRLNKAGGSRYLSVGKMLPIDWDAVKVYVSYPLKGGVVLRLEQIK